VIYRGGERGGWLWSPCTACGGTVVPLRDRASVISLVPGAAGDGLDRIDLSLAPARDGHACPGCETRRRRLAPAGSDPVVWFDTLLGDWVVQLPCPDVHDGTVLPLEIHWFDANWADVYRAAADIAYGDGLFAELG
jgi:hypothetical protein